jgi:hypothetical protein
MRSADSRCRSCDRFPDGHGFIHAADRFHFNAAASAHTAGLVAYGSRCPEAPQWLARFGKSANSAHTESVDAAMRRCTLCDVQVSKIIVPMNLVRDDT